MSNESNPASASLRLKPRLRPADEPGAPLAVGESGSGAAVHVAPPAAAAAGTAVAVAAEAEPAKVRLRPKLQPAATVPEPACQPPPATPPAKAVSPSTPPLFITDPPPAAPAPVVSPLPPSPGASAPAAAVIGDPGKFKLKPKVPEAPAAGSPPVPPLFLPDDALAPPPALATAPGAVSRPPMRAPSDPAGRSGKSTPPMPVPHLKVEATNLVPEVDLVVTPPAPMRGGWKKPVLVLLVLGAAGYGAYIGWPHLPVEVSVAGYTIRTKPGLTITKARAAPAASRPTPSETLNKLAQMPGNAINKAQDALAARRASGQDRVDAAAVGEDLPAKTFGVPPAAPIKPAAPPPKAPAPVTSVTTVAPGLSATMPVEAAPEAPPEFRAFVTNARISGIFQGNPARAVINGKLSRAGEVIDSGLGITFEGLDDARKNLVFKDRSGATVSRRF